MFGARPLNPRVVLFSVPGVAANALARAARWCADCQARTEQRRALAALDERMLKDVGLTTGDAAHESGKPFWRE